MDRCFIDLVWVKEELDRVNEEARIKDKYIEALEAEIDKLDEENNDLQMHSIEKHGVEHEHREEIRALRGELDKANETLKTIHEEGLNFFDGLNVFALKDCNGVECKVGDMVVSKHSAKKYTLKFGEYRDVREENKDIRHHGWHCRNEEGAIGILSSNGIWFKKLEI